MNMHLEMLASGTKIWFCNGFRKILAVLVVIIAELHCSVMIQDLHLFIFKSWLQCPKVVIKCFFCVSFESLSWEIFFPNIVITILIAGLFSRAAIQSGSAISEWTICRGPDARDRAFFLGTLLGIDAKTSKELVDGLKTKSAEDIVTATLEVNKQLVCIFRSSH